MPLLRRGVRQRRVLAGACCAFALLLVSAYAAAADALHAIVLVASGELPDPDFADSLVLVMNNLAPAPVGLIINRPTQISVAQLFPELKRLARVPDKVHFGGPVEIASVWFLFRAARAPNHAIRAFDDVYVSANRPLLLQLLGREKPMEGLRIFIGHSGWAPGQLEAEIARKDWVLQRAAPETIFSGKSEHPWPEPRTPRRST